MMDYSFINDCFIRPASQYRRHAQSQSSDPPQRRGFDPPGSNNAVIEEEVDGSFNGDYYVPDHFLSEPETPDE